jgi:hypothetical protein
MSESEQEKSIKDMVIDERIDEELLQSDDEIENKSEP